MSQPKSHKQYREERARRNGGQNNNTAMNPQSTLNPGCSIMVNNIGEERLLLSHLKPHMRVLEFGSGLSTNVIAKMVRQVVSIEYDNKWYNDFKPFADPNATILFVPANKQEGPGQDGTLQEYENYVMSALPYASTEKFDVVFIDGRARVDCAMYAMKFYLKPGGLVFIHDYKHPQQQYRRPEYEVVEGFLTLQKHVFAMACFTIKGQESSYLVDEPLANNIGEIPDIQSTVNSQQSTISSLKPVASNIADIPDVNQQSAVSSQQPAPDEPESLSQSIETQNPPLEGREADKSTCWHSGQQVVDEMNNFHDKHIKNHEITKHMEPFTSLLNMIASNNLDALMNSELLDLGCGTGMLSQFCKNFTYTGADLPHIITGCAMRNYPNYPYRICNMEEQDIAWIKQYDIVVLNGVIDIMEHAVEMLAKVLASARKYVIIHRQDILEEGVTSSHKNGSYGGETWHSLISRTDFEKVVSDNGFAIAAETNCMFGKSANGDWATGGRSFLLKRKD